MYIVHVHVIVITNDMLVCVSKFTKVPFTCTCQIKVCFTRTRSMYIQATAYLRCSLGYMYMYMDDDVLPDVCHLVYILSTETAMNIGYSSQLLTAGMRVFVIDKEDEQGVTEQLQEYRQDILELSQNANDRAPPDNTSHDVLIRPSTLETQRSTTEDLTFGIVINGHSLVGVTFCQEGGTLIT